MTLTLLACVSLVLAQAGTYLEVTLVPPPTSATTGPQGPADLVFGLLALVGGVLGLAFSAASGIVGVVVAAAERRQTWLIAIVVSGALAVLGLAVSAFVLVGLPRNPYHPLAILLVVPVTTLVFLVATRRRSSPPNVP